MHTGGASYLTIVQNKAQTSNNRFEWGEGICRFLYPMEQQFGCGRCSGPQPLEFVLICNIQLALVRTRDIASLIGNSRVIYAVWRTYQRQNCK